MKTTATTLILFLAGASLAQAQQPATAAAESWTIDVTPAGPPPELYRKIKDGLTELPKVRAALAGGQARLLSFRLDPAGDGHGFQAVVYDYGHNRPLEISGHLLDPKNVTIQTAARQPVPSRAEFQDAVSVVAQDGQLGAAIRAGELQVVEPMPPVSPDAVSYDPSVHRVLNVGLLPTAGAKLPFQIVGVDMITRQLVRYPNNAPPNARANSVTCNPPPDANQSTESNDPGALNVVARRNGVEIWRFTATRPSASSGQDGSGIDLTNVFYRGKKVLSQAHVPILNVHYDNNACGPYRDWQDQEGKFTANGNDLAPGFRRCQAPAQTILDNGSDSGNYNGVAIYVENNVELVLVSEMEAGWYRYVSEWRFREDGTILPRWGFDGVQNSCTCRRHHHNAYWRFDFDIAGGFNDSVQEYNVVAGVPRTDPIATEISRLRNPSTQRAWIVANSNGPETYTILPGSNDGFADDYAVSDMWALHYRSNEIDDNPGLFGTRAQLDDFLTGESVQNTHVVVWYSGHFTHDDLSPNNHIVGPTLVPANW